MRPTSVRKTRRAQVPATSIALFVDAEYVRCCAARSHPKISGARISASRASIDAGQISRFLDRLLVDFDLDASRSRDACRPQRRIYDTVGADRRQRWRQPHYRSALSAEGFVVRTIRAPHRLGKSRTVGDARDRCDVIEAALAHDLVRLASELTTVVLPARGEQPASAVWAAREQGAEIVLAIPASCGALVAEPLREAATRVIGLHPEVFEAPFEIREAGWQRPEARGTARPASVGAPR